MAVNYTLISSLSNRQYLEAKVVILLVSWFVSITNLSIILSNAGEPDSTKEVSVLPREIPVREHHAVAYDSTNYRMVMFGGGDGGPYFDDTYFMNLTTNQWTKIDAKGTVPEARICHSAIYDSINHQVVVFGGAPARRAVFNDCSALDLAKLEWRKLQTTGDAPVRTAHSALFDERNGRMIVFGGWTGQATSGEIFALDLKTLKWGKLDTKKDPLELPRCLTSAIYDSKRDRMVIFGGCKDGKAEVLDDCLALDLTSLEWQVLETTGERPFARKYHTAIYATERDEMVVFGGQNKKGNTFQDLYSLNLKTLKWKKISVTKRRRFPSPCDVHSAIYDPVKQRMIIFGGGGRNDCHALDLNTFVWTNLTGE